MRAAVALILSESPEGGLDLLFIERAQAREDPWSGQMAFPGGRSAPEDVDSQATAEREVHEELGIRLSDPIGQLDDTTGGQTLGRVVIVAAHVYALASRPELTPNHEVNSTVWIPLRWMLQPESAIRYRFEHGSYQGNFPAFRHGDHSVWGLTYRMVERFFEVLDRSLPSPPPLTRGWGGWD